jgi:excisionase family DNA binding protein
VSAVPSIGRLRTKAETAKFLGCSERTVERLVAAGALTCVKAPGLRGAVRFRDEDIADYLDRRSTGAAPSAAPVAKPARNPRKYGPGPQRAVRAA